MNNRISRENERIDEINFGIHLIQKTDGLTFGTDALLLSAFLRAEKNGRAAELGGGSGVISLLLLSLKKFAHIDCIEVQPDYAELIRRNAILNGMGDRLTAHAADIRDYIADGDRVGKMDAVFANPPYMPLTGSPNEREAKNIARHEVFGDIGDFCAAGARLLRFGGRFSVVYRPDRLIDLLAAMRDNRIEPKRMTFVHADSETPPSMVLVEGILGGKPSLKMTPPLMIYQNGKDVTPRTYTDLMKTISDTGSFPLPTE